MLELHEKYVKAIRTFSNSPCSLREMELAFWGFACGLFVAFIISLVPTIQFFMPPRSLSSVLMGSFMGILMMAFFCAFLLSVYSAACFRKESVRKAKERRFQNETAFAETSVLDIK